MSEDTKKDSSKKPEEAEEGSLDTKVLNQSDQMKSAMQMTAKLWSRNEGTWPEGVPDTRCTSLGSVSSSHDQGARRPPSKHKQDREPKTQQKRAYLKWSEAKVDQWFKKLKTFWNK